MASCLGVLKKLTGEPTVPQAVWDEIVVRGAGHQTATVTEQWKNASVHFRIIGRIREIETIATGGRIKDIMRLRRQYGSGKWRKMKGIASVELANGSIRTAEVHWYEAHGIGRKKMKIKDLLDE